MKSDIPVLDKLEVTAQFIEEAPRLGMSKPAQTKFEEIRPPRGQRIANIPLR